MNGPDVEAIGHEEQFSAIRSELGELLRQSQHLVQELATSESDAGSNRPWLLDITQKLRSSETKWREQRFKVAVLALIKAGKSTLINAMLGREYLPVNSVAETARIVRVRHEPKFPQGRLWRTNSFVFGAEGVREHLQELNKEFRKSRAERPKSEDELILEAPFVALAGQPLGEQGFDILDTPGPNEAGVERLRLKVDALIEEADIIIYLLDYTKLKGREEQDIHKRIASIRKDLLRNTERLFFVVNKFDAKDRNSLTAQETVEYVAKKVLEENANISIDPNRILITSASQALLARLIDSGEASKGAIQDFADAAMGIMRDPGEEMTIEDCRPFAARMLKLSRIPQLEDEIIAFIYKHRAKLLLISILDDLERNLAQFRNNLITEVGTLRADHAKLQKQVTQLNKDLRGIKSRLREIEKSTDSFKEEAKRSIGAKFKEFQSEINGQITSAFEEGGAVRDQPLVLFGLLPWGAARHRFESSDKSEIERTLNEINENVASYLQRQIQEFLPDLERDIFRRQQQLYTQLQNMIRPLLRQIESKVSQTLDIRLHPVEFKFPPDS